MERIREKVLAVVCKSGKKGVIQKELYRKLKDVPKKQAAKALEEMCGVGLLVERKHRFYSAVSLHLIAAEITRVNKTFGFAVDPDGTEFFIPGKYLMGSMPGDLVLVRELERRGSSPEAKVTDICRYGVSEFTGRLYKEGRRYFIEPDGVVRYPLFVSPEDIGDAADGDKVLAQIKTRGKRHSEHTARVISAFGDADSAFVCAQAVLSLAGISPDFPANVEDSAARLNLRGVRSKDCQGRLDLRNEIIFTIDGADAMDLDDAVSLEKHEDCYLLGVHIADVSHYVKYKSDLDREALHRGTSVYYANKVVPMLPKELSNGICSLHPDVDRLAFSALLTLDLEGHLIDYDFQKSIIRSRVKGVYDEVNQIFNGEAGPELSGKYSEVQGKLLLMRELADILAKNKRRRGAPDIVTRESKIVVDHTEHAVDIIARRSGEAQELIENFMLTANEAAAMAGKSKELPVLYRVHEPPSEEKLDNLNKTLRLLGIQNREFTENVKPKAFADILNKVKGSDIEPIVNLQILRSMSKAKYSNAPIGHYGLALENYAHFTSPIRRYPDLMVHRALSAVVSGKPLEEIRSKYGKFAAKAAAQSTQAEMLAMKIERECEDCYKAEYMHDHLGEEFDGIISSAAPHGIYVELPNTVEGMVSVDSLPEGQYDYDGVMQYREMLTGAVYRVGQTVKVACVRADVNSGQVDFILV